MPPGVFTERLKKESSLETETFLGVGSHEVAVEAGDVVHADAFRAGSFTFILVRAVAEAFRFHLLHHGQDALGTFRQKAMEQLANIREEAQDLCHEAAAKNSRPEQ